MLNTIKALAAGLTLTGCVVASAQQITIEVPLQCNDTDTIVAVYVQDGKHWQPLASIPSEDKSSTIVLIMDTRDRETHTWIHVGDKMCFVGSGTLSKINIEALGLKGTSKGMM